MSTFDRVLACRRSFNRLEEILGGPPRWGGVVYHLAMRLLRWTMAVGFLGAGVAHLVHPGFFVRIVPPGLPGAHGLVIVSGLAEIAGGVGLLVPRLRSWAGW